MLLQRTLPTPLGRRIAARTVRQIKGVPNECVSRCESIGDGNQVDESVWTKPSTLRSMPMGACIVACCDSIGDAYQVSVDKSQATAHCEEDVSKSACIVACTPYTKPLVLCALGPHLSNGGSMGKLPGYTPPHPSGGAHGYAHRAHPTPPAGTCGACFQCANALVLPGKVLSADFA